MKNKVFYLMLIIVFLTGCSSKEAKITYKEVPIPIKCQVEIPKKPTNDGSFEKDRDKMIYYRECERLLYHCVGESYGE